MDYDIEHVVQVWSPFHVEMRLMHQRRDSHAPALQKIIPFGFPME